MPIVETAAPRLATPAVRLLPVGQDRWRVIDRTGRALGQLVTSGEASDLRYRARRFHAASGTFRDIGEFCVAADAVECLRTLR